MTMGLRRCVAFLMALLLVVPGESGIEAQVGSQGWPDEWLADSAFYNTWSRADQPVAMRAAARSWQWGPAPFAVANEAYAESATGKRLVTYLDKARMEVNDPAADRMSPWFVTSGLLVREMVTGLMQTGNNRFESREPADVPVAGDLGNTTAPTYLSFARHTGPVPGGNGAQIRQLLARDGSITSLPPATPTPPGEATNLFSLFRYDEVTGHNVAGIFYDWMERKGIVLDGGSLTESQLFDPLFLLGRPITEPYWADVPVKGSNVRVLVQLFERRALTYNPQNPPEWQVELANVGRSYYEWRYGDKPPEPAISAELRQNIVQVRGWNWQAALPVRVEVDLNGATVPLSGPQNGIPDTSGRFFLTLPLTPQLQGALLAGANMAVLGATKELNIALPFAARNAFSKVQLAGELSQVSPGRSPTQQVSLTARDGKVWSLALNANTKITYSEGAPAGIDALRPGMAVSVEGTATGADVAVASLRLMSVSRTGATFGFTLQPDGKSLSISGGGWPAGQAITFTLRTLATDGGGPLASLTADSRGNVLGTIQLPQSGTSSQGLWIFATASEKNIITAQVAQPFNYTVGKAAEPPALFLLGSLSEQAGGLGSYCYQTMCVDKIGIPLPSASLMALPGEVLGLRSQYGPNPNAGITPVRFIAEVHPYPVANASQGTFVDGVFYFRPSQSAVYTTGELPGRPFSIALPGTLPSGRYAVVVYVTWPEGDGSYGFTLELGSR